MYISNFFHAAKSLIIQYGFFPGGNLTGIIKYQTPYNCIHFTAEAVDRGRDHAASRGQPPSRYVLAVHR